jgi:hypothetical protein
VLNRFSFGQLWCDWTIAAYAYSVTGKVDMEATNGPGQSQNRNCSRQNRAQGTRLYKSNIKNLEVA